MFKTTFEAYTELDHVWKFHFLVTIHKNSTAVTTNLTAATSFTITFYRKLLKTPFEAFTV